MGAMKDKMIDQMNQDWSAMYDRERAILDAERRIEEEMLWRELQQESEYYDQLEKAKIIREYENYSEEVQGSIGHGVGPEQSGIIINDDGQRRHSEHNAHNSSEQDAAQSGQKEPDSGSGR